MKAKALILLSLFVFALVSCEKEKPVPIPENNNKNVFEFMIYEPSLNLETYCGRDLGSPGRVSGMVCLAFWGTQNITHFQFKAKLSPKAIIEPSDNAWIDFTTPKEFTVTAEDGSDTTFWVTVGTVEGVWLKDGAVVDTMKFNLSGPLAWNFKQSALIENAFEFKIGRPCQDLIAGIVYDWDYQDFTILPKTFNFKPQLQSSTLGCAYNGGGEYCTDCKLTITKIDIERGVISGSWNFSFDGDEINGSIGTFRNAPLYGEF
jgi:hypothetical protein